MAGVSEKKKKAKAAGQHMGLRRALAVGMALLALLALVGCFSFLFTWKQDQSLLADSSLLNDIDVRTANAGGALGLKLGALLVGRWFGLGAFGIVVALAFAAVRLWGWKSERPMLRYAVQSLAGAFVVSLLLSYFSERLGLENSFRGGLGGACGAQMVLWAEKLVGQVVTICIIVALCCAWGYFSSRRFARWFETVADGSKDEGKRKPVMFNFLKEDAPEAGKSSAEAPESPVDEPVHISEPVAVPEPVPAVPKAAAVPVAVVLSQVRTPETTPVTETSAPVPEIIKGGDLSTDVQEELPRINVRDELPDFQFPSLNLLNDYADKIHTVSSEELRQNNFKIRATLQTYKIGVDDVKAVVGPTVTLYKIYKAEGVRIASIMNLQKEIAMALNTDRIRMRQLPDSIALEVPNANPSVVPLKALLNDPSFRNSKAELPVAIGYTITQKVEVFDLADAPHLLVAGATKQGKSVGLNVLITSLLYSKHPSELKFVFVDPKKVEFTPYRHLLHHYLAVLPDSGDAQEEMSNAIVQSAEGAAAVLKSLCIEMDERYDLLNKAGVNNVILYNDKYRDRHLLPTEGHRYLPYIVTVIDEYADLIMSTGAGNEAKALSRNITNSIIRLAQKGRAAGLHVVLATQRPSVDVITGMIKANFPSRIAFRVFSQVDSKTILDQGGAEKLIGRGDMLYYAGVDMNRVQCALISGSETTAITKFIGDQEGYKKSYNIPYYLPAPEDEKSEGTSALSVGDMDERFEEAARMVVSTQRGSTSDIQRRLGMGYAKAGRVMDQLEAAGIVGPQEGSKPRQVLIADMDELDLRLKELMAR